MFVYVEDNHRVLNLAYSKELGIIHWTGMKTGLELPIQLRMNILPHAHPNMFHGTLTEGKGWVKCTMEQWVLPTPIKENHCLKLPQMYN